ncbi:hybrid signal transduction histidine kinase M [Tanacetum coccineum]
MWILGSLCDSLQEQVITTPGTAKALWDHLQNLFHDNKDDKAINLDNDLYSIKIGKMSINEYCIKIKSMADRLKNLGYVVSNKNLVIYAVNGLDSHFATLVEIIQHREPLPTFETARNMLLLKESSMNDQSGASTTFESSSSSPTILAATNSSNNKDKAISIQLPSCQLSLVLLFPLVPPCGINVSVIPVMKVNQRVNQIHIDDKPHFVEEPAEIMDREVKRLKQSRIPIVKVRWNSRRDPEFTWEREDQFWKKVNQRVNQIHIDDKPHFVEEPAEIMDREVKRLKQSRIPIVKVRWNSRRDPEFTWEREDQFWKKVFASLHKNRTIDKCRILSLADKAPLMGEDCNNPLF